MSDRLGDKPTPEEQAEADALAAWEAGGDPEHLNEDAADGAALASFMLHPPTPEHLRVIEQRIVLPRPRRRIVRTTAIALLAAAASVLLWFSLQPVDAPLPPLQLPPPSAEIVKLQADAVKKGNSDALDPVMDVYRRALVQAPRLKAAEPTYTLVDEALRRGDTDAARAALTAFIDQPPNGLGASDARVLQRDALARLAALELRTSRPQQALASAERGLAFGKSADTFTVNLLLARANACRQLGDARCEGEALHDAIEILDAMLTALLDGMDKK